MLRVSYLHYSYSTKLFAHLEAYETFLMEAGVSHNSTAIRAHYYNDFINKPVANKHETQVWKKFIKTLF